MFVNTNFKNIFKIDISDHFHICFLQLTSRPREENKVIYITKRVINNNVMELFKQELYKTSWDDVINNKNPNDAYNYFSHKLIVLYDKYFPKQNIRIYIKDLQSPWLTRGIKKSSKRKQKLYIKFLKNRNSKNELEYKNYKKLFESIKKHAKKNYFSSLILKACVCYFSLFLKDKCISSLFRTKFRKNNLLIRKNNCMCNRDNARDVAACTDE